MKLTWKRLCSPLLCSTAMPCWWGLTRPKQLSMATTARVIWLFACVRYLPDCELVFKCVTCFIVSGIGISREKRAEWAGLTRKYGLETMVWAPLSRPFKILIDAWINTINYFSWELENINFIVQRNCTSTWKISSSVWFHDYFEVFQIKYKLFHIWFYIRK